MRVAERQPTPGGRRPNCQARTARAAEVGAVDGRRHEGEVLDERVGDRQPGGGV